MKRSPLLFILLLSLASFAVAQPTLPSGSEALRHIQVLAADSLEGRGSGTAGGEKAATYIEARFREYGLLPLGDPPSYRQPFTFLARVEPGPANALAFTSSLSAKRARKAAAPPAPAPRYDSDYRLLSMSASAAYSGGLVFVGYGLSIPGVAYDDYAGIDVKGKAVLVLRYTPEGDSPHSAYNVHAGLYEKAVKAREQGAAAVLFVNGAADVPEDSLIRLQAQRDQARSTLPVIHITRSLADRLLAPSGLTIDSLQASINRTKRPNSFPVAGTTLSLTTDVREVMATTSNVMGLLPGSDPALSAEILIVGAHYDHLGYGGPGSGSLAPSEHAIHNGADDNASGVGGLLELARTLVLRRAEVRRSILFLAFTGEELGLLGSAYYVKHPVLPLDRSVAMFNMDMIGRMHNRTLIVYGMGTAVGFDSLATAANSDSLTLKLNKDGYGPSDQSSFYGAKIPVMHVFTDIHGDYHKPTDDAVFIAADTLQPVIRYADRLVLALANAPARPHYLVAESPRPQGQGRGFSVWMGTIPDYAGEAAGMRITGVSANSPAERAGLKGGDVMVKFGTVEIRNVYDYTFALGEYKPGDEVVVAVMRGGQRVEVTVKLERRNR